MKTLLRNSFLLLTIALMYACTPKYTASFNYNTHGNANQQFATQETQGLTGLQKDEIIPEIQKEELLASNYESPEVIQENPIEELMEAHQLKIDEINKSGLEGRELKKELKKEQKKVKQEIRKEVKEARKADGDYALMMILAFLIPFLGVGLTYGITGEFWISLILTLIFWLPGMIYSMIVVHQHFKG